MQYKQTALQLTLLLLSSVAYSQTTYLTQGAKENILLERMEIKAQTDSVLNFSKTRPFSRRQVIPALDRLDTLANQSKVDQFNLYTAQMGNLEWTSADRSRFASRKPWGKNFFQTPATLLRSTKRFLPIGKSRVAILCGKRKRQRPAPVSQHPRRGAAWPYCQQDRFCCLRI